MMSLTPQEYIDNFCKYVQQGDLIQSAKYLKQMIDLRIKINIEYQSHNEQQPSEQNVFNPNDYLVDYEPQPIKIESQDNQKKVEVYSPADFSKYLNSSEPQQVQKQEQVIEIDNNQISDIDTDNELESKLEQVEETKRPEQQLYQSQQTTNKQCSRTPQQLIDYYNELPKDSELKKYDYSVQNEILEKIIEENSVLNIEDLENALRTVQQLDVQEFYEQILLEIEFNDNMVQNKVDNIENNFDMMESQKDILDEL